MTERSQTIRHALDQTRWHDWEHTEIAADASARRYSRLSSDAESVIMMDAPPQQGEDTQIFAAMTRRLRDAGLSAPEILLHDPQLGLMVLEDLGASDFAHHARHHPQDISRLYHAATGVLVPISQITPPQGLATLDPETGAEMVGVVGEWYARNCNIKRVTQTMQDHLQHLAPNADTLSLRDFHAENLIWRPDAQGHARVGLLDYQDAFLAPAGYDLASLLRDARRAVDHDLTNRLIHDFAVTAGLELPAFQAQFSILSVQRNLRILGVFARLVLRDHKPKYLAFMTQVWAHLETDLRHPALVDLAQVIAAELPSPDRSELGNLL